MRAFCGILFSAEIFASENWIGNYNLGFGIPLFGLESLKATIGNVSSSQSYDIKAGGYFIQPAFGLSITID